MKNEEELKDPFIKEMLEKLPNELVIEILRIFKVDETKIMAEEMLERLLWKK